MEFVEKTIFNKNLLLMLVIPENKKLLKFAFTMLLLFIFSNCGKKCNCDYENFKRIKENMTKSQVQSILNLQNPTKEKKDGNWLVCTYKCDDNFIVIELDKNRLVRTITYNTYP